MTKLEQLAPHLTALAASIGQKIARDRRSGQYVLTPCFRALTPLDNPSPGTAERQINRIIRAREPISWGTPYERASRAIEGLGNAEHHHGHITEWQHVSLDSAYLVCSFGEWDAGVKLVGLDDLRIRSASTRTECLAKLTALCRAKLRST